MEEETPDWKYYEDERASLTEKFKRIQKCHYFHSKLEMHLQALRHTLARREVLYSATTTQPESEDPQPCKKVHTLLSLSLSLPPPPQTIICTHSCVSSRNRCTLLPYLER